MSQNVEILNQNHWNLVEFNQNNQMFKNFNLASFSMFKDENEILIFGGWKDKTLQKNVSKFNYNFDNNSFVVKNEN